MQTPHTRPGTWPTIRGDRFASTMARSSSGDVEPRIALLGLPDETGVAMNGGRPGASEGPAAFRRALASYGTGHDGLEGTDLPAIVADAGDLEPARPRSDSAEDRGAALRETHARATEAVASLLARGLVTVCVGGGHDLTFPSVRALAGLAGAPVGGMNVDPHLDVRETLGSGMPFRAAIEGGFLDPERFVAFGAGRFANSAEHVRWAKERGATIVPEERASAHPSALNMAFERVSRGVTEPAFVSLDLDAMEGAAAPGVSAVNPFGLSVDLLRRIAWRAGATPAVRHFDLMELSPPHDDYGGSPRESGVGRTARIAAGLFLHFVAGVAERVR